VGSSPPSPADDGDLLAEEREALALDPAEPTPHQRSGGAGRGLAWLLIIGGLAGLWAAVMLLRSGQKLARDPDAALLCDINPIVGCGNFLLSWQSSALGVPNALLGTIAFSIVVLLGIALLAGARLPRWVWLGFTIGTALGALATVWFQYQALAVIRGLCPYCLVVWVVMPPIFFHVLGRAAQAGHLGLPEGLRRFLVMERHLLTVAWYVVIIALVTAAFWSQWALMW